MYDAAIWKSGLTEGTKLVLMGIRYYHDWGGEPLYASKQELMTLIREHCPGLSVKQIETALEKGVQSGFLVKLYKSAGGFTGFVYKLNTPAFGVPYTTPEVYRLETTDLATEVPVALAAMEAHV